MNFLEQLGISLLKKEAESNPQIISNYLGKLLTDKGVDAAIVADVQDFLNKVIPELVAKLP
jgi:hypothetical protein